MPLLNALFSRDKHGNRKRRLEIQSGNLRFSKDGNASVHKLDEHTNLVIGADGPRLERNEGNVRMTWGAPGEGRVAYQSHELPAKSCEKQANSYLQAIHGTAHAPADPCRFARHDFSKPFNPACNRIKSDN